jgi:peptide/nickel transport system permease protein
MAGRRLLLGVPVLIVTSVVIFALAAASPFDPLQGYLDASYFTATTADRERLTQELGLDEPWTAQYLHWAGDLLRGDLGQSRAYNAPVAEVIGERLPWTLLLVGLGLGVAVLLALVLGVWSAWRQGGWLDRVVTGLAHALEGVPPFVLGLAAVGVFGVALSWLPIAGLTDADAEVSVGQVARHLVLPVGVLAVAQTPWLLLHLRQSLLSALTEDSVRGARARGLSEPRVVVGHALPTALLPLLTLVGARLPEVVTGAILVEEIFSWPGVAQAVVRSALELDFPLLAAVTMITTAAVLVGALLADLAYALADPRVATDG